MATSIRKASITLLASDYNWSNKHNNVSQHCERVYSIRLPAGATSATILTDMLACAVALQDLLGQAITANQELRMLGGTWSLSTACASSGWLVDTLTMNLYWIMQRSQVVTTYAGDISNLYLAQGGMTVQDLNIKAEQHGKALSTSGASNGQTIAGAIATGTHGSAFQYGSMPEFVVGLYIVVAPDRIVWLERASYPVVSAAFVTTMGAELVQDDAMFNAALVSFGCFGMIAGVLLEAEKIYVLEAKRELVTRDAVLDNAMNTMDLSGLQLNPTDLIPWHFEITFNPHNAVKGYMQTMYKKDKPTNYQSPPRVNEVLGPGESLLSVIGVITTPANPLLVAIAVNTLMKSKLQLTDDQHPVTITTPNDTFTITTLEGKAMSMELGIAVEDSSKVLDLILGLMPEISMYTGVISYRWVKKSSATLGFTRFPITATIEFNAAHNPRTTDFYERIWDELEAEGIPYTLHWGQMNNFTPDRIQRMYGNAATEWANCRKTLLRADAQAVFSNDFLRSTGLE